MNGFCCMYFNGKKTINEHFIIKYIHCIYRLILIDKTEVVVSTLFQLNTDLYCQTNLDELY